MYKAIIGSFPSPEAAQGAISRLREVGFPGEHMALVVREPIGEGDVADATWPATGNRAMAALAAALGGLGLLIGAAVGYFGGGATLTTPGGAPTTALVTDALIGLGVGVVAGLLAGWLLAHGARRAERRWGRVSARRAETLLAVATDADSLPRARKVLAESAALEVRHGGLSEAEAFVLRATPVEADRYGPSPAGSAAPAAGALVDGPTAMAASGAQRTSPNGVPEPSTRRGVE